MKVPLTATTGILPLIVLCLIPCAVHASTTGAITGIVRDSEGNALVGASVMVDGSQFGAMTDGDGEYYIARLAPGNYSITARMVGMGSVTVQGVAVVSDQTTRIDLTMNTEAVGVTVVEVTGQRNLVLEDVPSTIHVVDRSEIETMPVASVLDVIERQAGVSSRGGEIHVRGGRSGEVAFLLDGVSVRSPVTNAFVSTVPLSAISEASTTTGGFDAEYGNALSGIVSMVVREGGSGFESDANFGSGSMTAFGSENEQRNYSQPSENDNYRSDCLNGEFSLGGPEPLTSYLLPAIGLHIPGEMRFFGAGEWLRSGFDLEDSRGNWENNWQNNLSGCLNLTYRPEAVTSISCLGRYSYRQSGWDEWAWSRYDQPAYIEGQPYLGGSTDYALPIRFDETWGITSTASRMLGQSSILELLVDRSEFCQWRRVRDEEGGYIGEGLTPAAWFGEFFPERAADSLGFYHAGIHPSVWLESRSSVTSGKIGLTSQLNRTLELKTGIEGNYYDIYDFSVYANGPGQTWVSNWRAYPSSGAVYLQTSANFSGAMVLNTGLRLDVFNPNTRMIIPGESGSTDVPIKIQVSPRIGMTHPISDRDVFFVTYGHYFQMPNLNQMFCGSSYNLSGNFSIVGNPDLDAVRTISYEAGVRHRLNDLSTLSFSAFYKQITGLVQTTPSSAEGLDFFFMYENDDSYATVQGAELTLLRLPGQFWSGSASYTYSVAEGRYSSPTEQFDYSIEGYSVIPGDDSYLDWDQRHTASAHLSLSTDQGEGPVWGGFHPFEGSALTLDWSWGSGYPFSPASSDTLPTINTLRCPSTMQTDMSASRRFRAGPIELEAKATVFNLFGQDNIDRIFDPTLYTNTGDPGGIMSNPAAYSPARHIFFSLGTRW
jgi:outer membrane receptor protein involved in Fe transport